MGESKNGEDCDFGNDIEPINTEDEKKKAEEAKLARAKSEKESNPELYYATYYVERGWFPIPVRWRSKKGAVKDWPNLRISKRDELLKYFCEQGQHGTIKHNVGLLTGVRDSDRTRSISQPLVDVDNDCSEARDLAPKFLPQTRMIHGRPSSPLSHYWYTCLNPGLSIRLMDSVPNSEGKYPCIIELRSTKRKGACQTVVPPSIHDKTGEHITWLNEETEPSVAEWDILKSAVEKIWREVLKLRGHPIPELVVVDETEAIENETDTEDEGEIEYLDSSIPIMDLFKNINGFEKTADGYQGPHPVHGSDSGHNFSIDIKGNQWHCFRCNAEIGGSGGGPLLWIGVKEGIINCKECLPDILSRPGLKNKLVEIAKLKYGFDLDVNLNKKKLSDVGNAKRFIKIFGQDTRWVKEWKSWVRYESRWARVSDERVLSLAEKVADLIFEEAEEEYKKDSTRGKDDKKGDGFYKWGNKTLNETRMKSVLSLSKGELEISSEIFDTQPYLLNVKNGTIDLRSGVLQPHNKNDWITKKIDIDYDKTSQCLVFEKFLCDVFENNSKLINYVKRCMGYSITGETRERILPILFGPKGKNGKTTTVNVMMRVLGEYAKTTAIVTLSKKGGAAGTAREDLVSLKGARFVSTQEADEDTKLNEGLVKTLTGKDPITARGLFQRQETFIPQFKIWFGTNYLPEVKGVDGSIWDRLKVIPFNVRFEGEAEDKAITEKLILEEKGILALLVQEAVAYYKGGIIECNEVRFAGEEWKEEVDDVEMFIVEKCEIGKKSEHKETFEALYRYYEPWCRERHIDPRTRNSFSRALTAKGFGKSHSGRSKLRTGIQLKEVPIKSPDFEEGDENKTYF